MDVLIALEAADHYSSVRVSWGGRDFMRMAWYWTGMTWMFGRMGGLAVSWVRVCWIACWAAAGV